MNLMSHLAQLLAYMVDKQLCTREVGLDCSYDQPLKQKIRRVEVQDPLEEVDLGENGEYRPTYVSILIAPDFKSTLIEVFKEYKDCFA